MANAISNIFGKLKDKFNNTSSSNIEENDKLKQSLNAGKTISIKAPKSERYTYYAGLAGKKLEKFRPETPEEKDTLSPIGFFRTGERDSEAQKKIQERIKAAASMMQQKELTPDQEKLVTAQAQQEQPFTQDIPNIIIPDPGTPAVPMDARVAVKTMVTISASVRSMPKHVAMKIAQTPW